MRRASWKYALVYTCLSLGIEVVLIVVGRLRVPDDNRIIAPIILAVPPILAAWISGYRARKVFIVLVGLTTVLTLAITIVFGRLTGISTGLAAPIVIRFVAGLLAGALANKVAPQDKGATP